MSNNKNKKPKNSFFRNPLVIFLILSIISTVVLNSFLAVLTSPKREEVTYDKFLTLVKEGKVGKVEFTGNYIEIYEKAEEEIESPEPSLLYPYSSLLTAAQPQPTMYYTGYLNDDELLPLLNEYGVEYSRKTEQNHPILEFFLSWILPLLLMYLFLSIIMRTFGKKMGGGGFMNVGQSNAKVYMENKTGVTFKDVAGQEEAKESLDEIVDFLHNPSKYIAIGAKQPKGALLVGPPGTGKTLLAKAVAGEASVPFFSITGSDFVEMFVGVGASRVRDLFKQAAAKAPCIIFIDEIDAIGKSRDTQYGGGNEEREQTLNQLLSEMDGFDSSRGVVILAATNRPEILDKALLRPGRFDRRIIVEKPDLKGREDILKVHSKNVKMSPDIDLHDIALSTSGAVGADLANMINEAALRAVRMKRQVVTQEDLMEAVEVVIAGKEKKDRILSEKEKRIVAYHEVGHALAAALQKNTDPVQKITIVPRTMGSLGYTMQKPEEEHYLMTADEMISEIIILLAGRCAEELIFNTKTTGAANDIERATALARAMISQYGMSDKFGMTALETTQSRYLDGRTVPTCSEETLTELDNEIIKTINSAHDRAMQILTENIDKLNKISQFLIEEETITGKQFMSLLNEKEEAEPETEEE